MISICIHYYNRRQLLINTIDSIRKSNVKDLEICIVDDASDDVERIDDLILPDMKYHRYEKSEKWWNCPVIPANKSVEISSGDKIILLGSECYMKHDIPEYVDKHLELNNYLVFGTYALNKSENFNNYKLQNYGFRKNDCGWYQHSKHRSVGYNFCTAIMRQDFYNIGQFDEQYAAGIAYGDTDFIRTVKKHLNVIEIDDLYVLHQWHKEENSDYLNSELAKKNENIYNNKT